MVRPIKSGIDYFPLDTNMEQDDKIALIEAKHGVVGFGVIIKMFKKIYGSNGYYYDWNEQTQLLFAKSIGIDFNKIIEIIDDAIKWDLFNKKLWKTYSILTSKRIQKTYLEATGRRKEVEIIKEYMINGVNEYKNKDNVNIYSKKDDISTQRKGKEKKGKYNNNSIELKLSELLLEKIKERNPEHKEPDLQKWGYNIDLMIRIDKRNPEVIEKIIIWCQQDEFWQNNILSTAKLRNQYDQLFLKMNPIKVNKGEKDWSKVKIFKKEIYKYKPIPEDVESIMLKLIPNKDKIKERIKKERSKNV